MYELLSGGKFPYGKIDDMDYNGEPPAYRYPSKGCVRTCPTGWITSFARPSTGTLISALAALSEFLFSIDHPGEITIVEERQPLIIRRPLAFWKWITFSQTVIITS